jgi:hypothetical protein
VAALALEISPAPAIAADDDPIFAAIEAHKAASAIVYSAVDAVQARRSIWRAKASDPVTAMATHNLRNARPHCLGRSKPKRMQLAF